MFWKLWAAILLLTWISASHQIKAARIPDYDLLEASDSEELPTIETGTLLKYPTIGIIKSTAPRGGYIRRRLPGRGKDAATTTTERPFVRVWNSILRSVQPNFGIFNITNPLANIFTNGNSNIIETVPMNTMMTNEADEEAGEEEEEPTTTKKPSIKKKKRTQAAGPSLNYYGVTLPLGADGYQPFFYYDPNLGSFINMRRIHANSYNTQFNDEKPSDEKFIPVANLRELNSPQLIVRPLKFALKVPTAEPATVDENKDDVSVANDVIDSATNEDVDSATKDDENKAKEHLSSIAPNDVAPFSESMRNALGTYMSDDRQNQQRQRQSEHKSDTIAAPAKANPRQIQQFFLLHAW